MAREAGYFAEEGLDVDVVFIDSGATMLAAMHNREIDASAGGGPTIVLGHLQGLETVLIGSTVNVLEASVFVRPGIRTVDDLRGKTIGVNRLKAITDVAARLAFQRAGLTPDVDVFTRGTGGQAEALAGMEAGLLDGISVNVPLLFEARQRGYYEMFNIGKMGLPFLKAGISSTRQRLREQPDLGDRYLRALARAMSRLKTDRERSIEVFAKYTQLDDRELLGATIDHFAPLYTLDPYPEPEAVQMVIDVEENPGARTLTPADVTDYGPADRLRASGLLDTLPR
jgi:NitT/TauT family transport system substrate-binding protein